MEAISHHPQLVKRVELLVELGTTCLPDAAEVQRVTDLRDEHREDLLPVVNMDFERRRDLLHDQGLQDLLMIGSRGLGTRQGKGDLAGPNISPLNIKGNTMRN